MATDVDVQFFSHLNGLVLDNKWGDMIRLLDACLVNGVELPGVTSASIDEQGCVHLTLFAPHKAMLLQVVELNGFEPLSLNQKYRIKGVPSDTQLILKSQVAITETAVTTKGAGKLASLGYDIIFRDDKDVKRVYRAKNPAAQHPYIRIDESITDIDTGGSYNSAWAKSAMVGLLENMTHIDDYKRPDVQQLPFDSSDPLKNWRITGPADATTIRGWSKWTWARNQTPTDATTESSSVANGPREFTLVGDRELFYLLSGWSSTAGWAKILNGCGLYSGVVKTNTYDWFLMTGLRDVPVNQNAYWYNVLGGTPLVTNATVGQFYGLKLNSSLSSHVIYNPIIYSYASGRADLFNNSNIAPISIGVADNSNALRGNLKHVCFAGKAITSTYVTAPIISDSSMYITDSCMVGSGAGGLHFYLGELE